MALKTEWIRYGAEPCTGYLAYPERAKAPLPAVIVLQEAWGVDAHIEDVTRRFAGAGYVALAPDLYAKAGERPAPLMGDRVAEVMAVINALPPGSWADPARREAEIAKRPPAEAARINESFAAVAANIGNARSFVPAMLEAARYLREEQGLSRGQRIGAVGFCLGGGLSALLACHDAELAAAVIFYGNAPPADLVPNIRCPVLGLYGAHDARINQQIPAFEDAMKRAGKDFEHVIYENAEHAFFNDGRPTYDARASRDALLRTLELFRAQLGS